jgi:hypothetical protein
MNETTWLLIVADVIAVSQTLARRPAPWLVWRIRKAQFANFGARGRRAKPEPATGPAASDALAGEPALRATGNRPTAMPAD